MRTFLLSVAAMGIAAARVAAQHPVLPELDRFLRAVAERAAPIAVSVAVVHGDAIVHLAGYGTSYGPPGDPVTAETPFYIASSTKSFTALTAALLAARGAIDLDAPVTRYAPEFTLPAPLDASRVTLRRLLSHRGGFESGPLSFRTAYVGDVPADSLLPLLARTAQPVDTGFTYTNTAFITAARVLERATGTPWPDLVRREVLAPLGVPRTAARTSEVPASWRAARGFGPGAGGHGAVAGKPDATMHAAGGMVTSAADAAQWLRAQLNSGRVGGRQVFPARVIAETHRPLARQDATFEGIPRVGYALGWQLGIVDGDTLYHHFGNYPGAFANVSFLPAHTVGVAVFLNSEMPAYGRLSLDIAQRAYDLVLGRRERDLRWAAYPDSLAANVERMFATFRADRARRAARPSVPPRGWAAYAGTYTASDMGTLTITALGDSAAELRYGVSRSRLEVLSGDTLRAEMPVGRGGTPAPATFDATGRAQTIVIAGRRFVRVAGAS